jgi:hypothetical protein
VLHFPELLDRFVANGCPTFHLTQVINQKPLYLAHGPPSMICTYTDGLWILGFEVQYGKSALQQYYTPEDDDAGNLDQLVRSCMVLPGTSPARVAEVGVNHGWWVDALQLRTYEMPGQYSYLGAARYKSCSSTGCKVPFDWLKAPEPKAYLAAFTLFVDPETRYFMGMQFHWGRDD